MKEKYSHVRVLLLNLQLSAFRDKQADAELLTLAGYALRGLTARLNAARSLCTIAVQGDFGKLGPALAVQSDGFDAHGSVTEC